jgi:ABC-2 type transport system ATP-binding protein
MTAAVSKAEHPAININNVGGAGAPITKAAIAVENIVKRYGSFEAVKGIDFQVADGEIFGLLGPNGAGKSTLIRMMTTLIPVTSGRALVGGYDVSKNSDDVRRMIGVIPQALTSDPDLTVEENLSIYAKLYSVSRAQRVKSITEVLEAVDLLKWRDAQTKTLSGGMRRRLEIARGLVHNPRIFFLDEPTTGLDPESRNELWDLLRQLVGGGTTLILTTQYLEEADQLADDVVLLDHGKIVATGSPGQLKARHGGERVVITVDEAEQLAPAASALERVAAGHAEIDREGLFVTAPASESTRLIEVVRALEDGGVDAHDVRRREATLDDVFFSLTSPRNRAAADDEEPTDREEAAA